MYNSVAENSWHSWPYLRWHVVLNMTFSFGSSLVNAWIDRAFFHFLIYTFWTQVIEHKPYDHRADVFSYAIVLWELLTGEVRLLIFFLCVWNGRIVNICVWHFSGVIMNENSSHILTWLLYKLLLVLFKRYHIYRTLKFSFPRVLLRGFNTMTCDSFTGTSTENSEANTPKTDWTSWEMLAARPSSKTQFCRNHRNAYPTNPPGNCFIIVSLRPGKPVPTRFWAIIICCEPTRLEKRSAIRINMAGTY